MPFKSEKQRRLLWAKHPEIAEAWAHGRSSVTGRKETRAQQGKRKRRRVKRRRSRTKRRR